MSPRSTSSRIRSNLAVNVNLRNGALFFLCFFLVLPIARADNSEPTAVPGLDSAPPGPGFGIIARTYDISIVRRSQSNKMYLIDDPTTDAPKEGKILLLKEDRKPVMGLRVMKSYPDKKEFAAKRIRMYGDYTILDEGDEYAAIEKVGDLLAPPPTAQDKADIKELETPQDSDAVSPRTKEPDVKNTSQPVPSPGPSVLPYDPELDKGSSPSPTSDSAPADQSATEDDSLKNVTLDDVVPLDPHTQWLSAELGFLNNNIPATTGGTSGSGYFPGGGFRYGVSIAKMVFLKKATIQDSITPEVGVFFYKLLGQSNDAYAVMPLIGTLRYNIIFSQNFGFFLYGGVVQNVVLSASSPVTGAVSGLSSFLPAAGGGILFRVGPSWYTRLDAGIDTIGLGLVLRF